MLPAIIFVGDRDDARHRAPDGGAVLHDARAALAFLLGRFSAGTLAALLVGLPGCSGALVGIFHALARPGSHRAVRLATLGASLACLVLPNLLVFCALFFSVAALTRSAALTFGAALGVMVLDALHQCRRPPAGPWLLLVDPFGALPVAEAARFWTVTELNTIIADGAAVAEPHALARCRAERAALHAVALPDGARRSSASRAGAPQEHSNCAAGIATRSAHASLRSRRGAAATRRAVTHGLARRVAEPAVLDRARDGRIRGLARSAGPAE